MDKTLEDTTPIDPTWMSKTGGYAKDMTLRDYYAGLAMQGIIACTPERLSVPPTEPTAKKAYQIADAMLKAREGK